MYACENIIEKLNHLKDELSKNTEEFNSPQVLILNNEKIYHLFKENMSDNNILYTLRLENEDYTIGKLIEKHMDLNYYKYVSFKKEHPHDSYSFIHFVYKNEENSNEQVVIKNLIETITTIINKFINILNFFKT